MYMKINPKMCMKISLINQNLIIKIFIKINHIVIN